MTKTQKDILTLALVSLTSTILVWVPFLFNLTNFWNLQLPSDGMASVVKNFDGLYYIVVAKSLYAADIIKTFEFTLPVEYYAAHYPLYPLLIRIFGNLMNYPYAMLSVTVLFSILAVSMFYLLLKELKITQPFWLSLIFLFLPARWLAIRSVGTPETIFTFLILLSIWAMYKKNYWLAGLAGGLAQITKPPAMVLFAAYGMYLIWQYIPPLIKGGQGGVNRKQTNILISLIKAFPWHTYP